ncbi:hypothetical protein KMW28_27975 [Flammeovirga yaeyamensis]|uniref:DUF4180 domain-containing protein n=1 Tax=Flammeovirga yaeyamensis TaxID=367791 RepID=A0AAX1NB01_9BACT|nr:MULTISPECIES: hypothetical protein [Flammeovirga]ANQ52435.1 hypothetical protein MY04_5100 [Flammeovirga sp. MY04]MBB3699874.1 hypothetical protein [Flammeovirga yaeyamensis]NMF38329.1 hypothetical protein [Flammeovirga yaeyamensis]QWG04740.1 hypothetical protein KMW28_27975 [Flammeovirga yaeyamensis]
MNYFISTNNKVLKLKLQGKITDDELLISLNEFAKKIAEDKIMVGVVDGKELTNTMELASKYSVISTLERLGFQRNCRFYIASNSPIEESRIVENIAFNRGWRLYMFESLVEATAAAEKFILNNSEVI